MAHMRNSPFVSALRSDVDMKPAKIGLCKINGL